MTGSNAANLINVLATSQTIFQLVDIIKEGFPSSQHSAVELVSDNEEDNIIDEFLDALEEPLEDHQPHEQAPIEQEQLEDENENLEVEGPALVVFYRFEKDFPNMAAFKEFLAAEGCWSMRRSVQQTDGIKTTYRCNKVKKRGLQCSTNIYSLHDFAPDDPTIKLFRKNVDHNCEHSLNKVTKVADNVRELIIAEHNKRNKVGAILNILRENIEIIQPTKNQVINIIDEYKKNNTATRK